MYLQSLTLTNFRNYQDFEFNFKNSLIILTGPNASGKTNLLEAIRLLSLSKSFRARSDFDLVRWDMDYAKIRANIKKDHTKLDLDITIEKAQRRQKTIKINGVEEKAFDLIGELVTVLFSPEDLNLINSSPGDRRKYLDIAICQVNKDYCRALAQYKKVLQHRNQVLSNIKEGFSSKDELTFWNEKLVTLGTRIIIKRKKAFNFFNEKLSEVYNEICNTEDQVLKLTYRPNLPLIKNISIPDLFRQELENKQDREVYKTYTLVGPHRDNFIFNLNNNKLSTFGSRGECRSAILALKSVELDYLESSLHERPVLLLDDVFSELDKERRNHMFKLVSRQQTFITTADFVGLEVGFVREAQVIKIKEGKITNK